MPRAPAESVMLTMATEPESARLRFIMTDTPTPVERGHVAVSRVLMRTIYQRLKAADREYFRSSPETRALLASTFAQLADLIPAVEAILRPEQAA